MSDEVPVSNRTSGLFVRSPLDRTSILIEYVCNVCLFVSLRSRCRDASAQRRAGTARRHIDCRLFQGTARTSAAARQGAPCTSAVIAACCRNVCGSLHHSVQTTQTTFRLKTLKSSDLRRSPKMSLQRQIPVSGYHDPDVQGLSLDPWVVLKPTLPPLIDRSKKDVQFRV